MKQYERTDYIGVDYSIGLSNINLKTGIRYGVIPHQDVGAAWYEDAEAYYGEPTCPHCGNELANWDLDEHTKYEEEPGAQFSEFVCENCEKIIDEEWMYPEEPMSHFVDSDGYKAEQTDEVDIFITKSPFFTYAQFCSPCAPGACYLPSPLHIPNMGNRCFCFGHEWFEDERAPYPVYSVETERMVKSERGRDEQS
jgi:hypothetical protein